MTDTIVVGAGHNGLVAAYYLARAGRKPLVLERRGAVGGGVATGELHPGFRAPILTHEVLVDEGIARDMRLGALGVELLTAPVAVAALAADGSPLVLHRDAGQASSALARRSRADAAAYPAFVEARARYASIVADALAAPAPRLDRVGPATAWRFFGLGRRFRALGARDAGQMLRWLPMSVADLFTDLFETDLLRAALAGPGLSGNALGPQSGGSVFTLLMREAVAQRAGGGGRIVRGGPGRLTDALARAAVAAGAEIRTDAAVDAIVVEGGRAVGAVVNGRTVSARVVVSALDPKTTLGRLLDESSLPDGLPRRVASFRAHGTLAKVNLALSALPRFRGTGDDPQVLTGRIHVGGTLDAMEAAFDHVKYGECSPRPWLEMTIPSILDPSLAPPGAHVASIYVHYAPARLRGGWTSDARDACLASVLRVLDDHAPGLSSQIVAAQTLTPADLEAEYGLAGGHVFHGELALDQLVSLRPLLGYADHASPVPGLYLCGAGTHPGGFASGISGRLAAERVLRDRG